MPEVRQVTPGFYVMRRPSGSPARQRTSLIVESMCFAERHSPGMDKFYKRMSTNARDVARRQADNWRDFIAAEHPKDQVFVVEVFPDAED